jgi:type I restriction enzyme S subunit
MAVKSGYKQTEVGVIPDEWEPATIGEVATFSGGAQPSRSTFKFAPTKGYVRLIQIRDYKTDDYASYIPETMARKRCTEDDIMIGRYGPPIFQILRGIEGAYNVALIKATPSHRVDREFFFYILCQEKLFERIDSLSRRTSGQTGIEMPALKTYGLALPPLPEQCVIAMALSDVDALQRALERLIAKKRDLKQATMQQLLTGLTRLPGFLGQWEVKTLGELFNFSGGYSASRDQLSNEGHCYLHYGDIHGAKKTCIDTSVDYEDIPKLDISLKQISLGSLLEDGDVVFVDASEDDDGTSRHVVVVNKDRLPFIAGLHTIIAKSKTDELAHEYRRYCFQTAAIRKQFFFYAVGTKVSGISKSNIPKLTIPVPSVPEQTAIAAILTDMDAELVALEQRLAKTRTLKLGMMQELLTGRARLL